MAQRKQLSWTELRVGVFVLAGIVLIVLGIFYVTGTGALGPKYHLVTYLPEVAGLTLGAPVTVDGVDVGNVDTIRMAPARPGQPPNRDRAVEVVMRLNRDFQNDIRSDSTATLFTEGFVGNRVVNIHRGFTGQVLRDGQEVPGSGEKALTQVVSQGADLMANLNMLTSQISQMVAGATAGPGHRRQVAARRNRLQSPELRSRARRSDHSFRPAGPGHHRQAARLGRPLRQGRFRRRPSR